MKTDLKDKLYYLRQEAEKEVVYYRNRMIEAEEEGAGKFSFEFYQNKLNESKAYLSGMMDTINTIVKEQVK
tara:strand:+ start:395 stop:607 length:213 start_codon:yes stop_codon:yes gene_type:complete